MDDGGQGQAGAEEDEEADPVYAQRPSFNITTMSNNFRRFNARIGVVFDFQARVERLLSWRRVSHTLSFLSVYTFVCLDPYLLTLVPPAVLLVGVLIPSFLARHPEAPAASEYSSSPTAYYSARGPPLAPARTVKPAKELSRDFFRNMGDLQNSMEDFSVLHDGIVSTLVPATNFSDEAFSSALFVALAAACLALSLTAHLLPWRLLALAAGWAVVASGHPAVARLARRARATYLTPDRAAAAHGLWDGWVAGDVILDEAPEAREVEIFELQRRVPGGSSGEWTAWVFSPAPYDPLSAPRIAGDRPAGTRFFDDVRAPDGWEWSEKKWALDLWSREWVEERIITGVEVETEGERWVYDIYNEHEATAGVVENPPTPASYRRGRLARGPSAGVPASVSWEEGEEGMGRRGEWRRRRWVRMVKRKKIAAAA